MIIVDGGCGRCRNFDNNMVDCNRHGKCDMYSEVCDECCDCYWYVMNYDGDYCLGEKEKCSDFCKKRR